MGNGRGDGHRAAGREPGLPWQARARRFAQRIGVDPRYLRRLRWIHKAAIARRNGQSVRSELGFVLWDPEPNNFTFEIANDDDLAFWVSTVAGCPLPAAEEYLAEPSADGELQQTLRKATSRHRLWSKAAPPFGKRAGWYALVRVLRPQVIIETGVHDGLGSLLLLRALERNERDGHPGRLISFDVNPTAGWLVQAHPLWELRIESSRDGLPRVLDRESTIDMFIYDGWHHATAERHDHELVAAQLSPEGVLISDDAQTTHVLAGVCREIGFDYFEFCEAPRHHFHPGSTLGAGRRSN